ncbi:uncharacterized protein LOC111899454 [Lactuca sativa]|uniref:uncharacterized protein LOC111899454 n=1 Tax=Lactuca sativa TaxID=4236 RepID=UPI000CD85F76|nr:uncharacterized protein LOC111899454 [Lactuca sativa]
MRTLEKENQGVSFELKTEALSNMDDLMILQLNYVKMNGSDENFPTQLRWLCMHGFPLKYIPLELRMDNLVALDLSYSKIESFDVRYTNPSRPEKKQKLDGSCSKEKKLLGSLKILDLSFCEQLRRVGGFDGLHALERLILTNCIHLLEVCESIEQCAELGLLDLSYFKTLKKLPRTIRMLKKVKTLSLDGCNLGESQTKISDMDSVILEAIPNDQKFFMISLPRSLVSLSFENANLSNESFPMDFSCLSMLKELYLDENPIVSLPNCVRNLPRLVILSMKKCKLLMSIENPPYTLAFLDIYSISEHKPLLQKVSFVPEMSPLELSLGGGNSLAPSSLEIEGMVKIQPMTSVQEKVLHVLGWTNLDFTDESRVGTYFLLRGPEESEIQMYYEFGIFSTIYGGEKMPNWISSRSKGPSISFTIPSSPNNLRGLNFCSVQKSPFRNIDDFLSLPLIIISNRTKKQTWIYEHYIHNVSVGGGCAILLSHWMYGMKEMEDGKRDEEEDALGSYKSWNHIIGGDLTGFELTTGEYILHNERFLVHGTEVNLYHLPLVGDGAIFKG